MGYRDDVDTLYTRAMILQRELDAAKDQLAERDAELARARGGAPARAGTSPGMRELREMPDPDDVLARLVTIPEYDEKLPRLSGLPPLKPLPMPDWTAIAGRTSSAERTSRAERTANAERNVVTIADSTGSKEVQYFLRPLVERVREQAVRLSEEDLLLVAKIVDELTDKHDGMDEKLRARLHWLASEIALVEKTPRESR